jgi:two-component system, NarL family, response regulator DevR
MGNMEAFTLRPVRVVIVDDHELVRRGLQDLLETKRDISVVGEYATASQAVRAIPRLRPDVMVLDVHLRDGTGVMVCREVRARNPEIKGLLLTGEDDDAALVSAVVAGAHGYALKDSQTLNLAEAIRHVGAGASLIPPAKASRVVKWLESMQQHPAGLTERECRTLGHVVAGLTGKPAVQPSAGVVSQADVDTLLDWLTHDVRRLPRFA